MDLDSDLRLRLAVFDHVSRLRHEHGGVIPSGRLNEGLVFDGRRVPIWSQQRGIYKPAILGRDMWTSSASIRTTEFTFGATCSTRSTVQCCGTASRSSTAVGYSCQDVLG